MIQFAYIEHCYSAKSEELSVSAHNVLALVNEERALDWVKNKIKKIMPTSKINKKSKC